MRCVYFCWSCCCRFSFSSSCFNLQCIWMTVFIVCVFVCAACSKLTARSHRQSFCFTTPTAINKKNVLNKSAAAVQRDTQSNIVHLSRYLSTSLALSVSHSNAFQYLPDFPHPNLRPSCHRSPSATNLWLSFNVLILVWLLFDFDMLIYFTGWKSTKIDQNRDCILQMWRHALSRLKFEDPIHMHIYKQDNRLFVLLRC